MIRKYLRRGVLAMAACLVGCASPATRFHTLEAVAQAGSVRSAGALSIVVAQVGVPARVDRRQLVLGVGQVRIEEFDHWAAPLREELGRALALNLVHLLGFEQIAAWPQNVIADPDLRIFVDVARFESEPGDHALIEAGWSIRDRQNKQLGSGRRTCQERPSAPGLTALVSAHNTCLAALSADISASIPAP